MSEILQRVATLRAFAKETGLTVAVPCENGLLFFSTDTCESCGSETQAPNAVIVDASPGEALAAGIELRHHAPPEMWATDDGDVCCARCLKKAGL